MARESGVSERLGPGVVRIFGKIVSFAPSGLFVFLKTHPPLARWAVFLRSFGAEALVCTLRG